MAFLFCCQFWALFKKNWIVLSKHPFLNLLRCFILPVAYGIFLAVAQLFLIKPNNYGIGDPAPIFNLQQEFDASLSLVWADLTNGTSTPSPSDIMSLVTAGFSQSQFAAVKQVATADDMSSACRPNFNLFSECYAGVSFNTNATNHSLNYTLRADAGLIHIDINHKSDFERRLLPLQWAIDRAIIQLESGAQMPTPLEWPFTQETNQEQSTDIRLSYIRGLRTLLVLALFICYIGVVYQLPGAFAGERANLLTAHLKAMGLLDSSRIISWILSISLAYLPAWIIVSLTWHFRVFTGTNAGLIVVVHLLLGLSLASWSIFTAVPFGNSPQLAAVFSTILAIGLAVIALTLDNLRTGPAFVFTIIFPPGFYIFAIRCICGFENHQIPTSAIHPDPDKGLTLLPLLTAALIDVFLWPWLAVRWENGLYGARNPKAQRKFFFGRKKELASQILPEGTMISIQNLGKSFYSSTLGLRKRSTVAVENLSMIIPKHGIFVLLGSNGAGKSTTLSILAGLTGRTSGSITFEGGRQLPLRGDLGIVPQKNVLFPDLNCYQSLQVWSAVKRSRNSPAKEDLVQLLRDCDLGAKIHANAESLSGGQKRKLQLAIGLVGGSKLVLVDECTSGVDPLSRRSLWRTLSSFKDDRTIVFTTHFLDEADLLADNIAILAAPGKLVASGTPVSLKRDLGEGYSVLISFRNHTSSDDKATGMHPDILQAIRDFAPDAFVTDPSPQQAIYRLKSKETSVVEAVLDYLESEKEQLGIESYDVLGTSIEDIFLRLMSQHEIDSVIQEKPTPHTSITSAIDQLPSVHLDNSRSTSLFRQAWTIFYKRLLVAKRSWLSPLLMFLVAVLGSTVPLVFLSTRAGQTCQSFQFQNATSISVFLPESPIDPILQFSSSTRVLTTPPNITMTLGNATEFLRIRNIQDNSTFIDDVRQNFRNLSYGGISMDLASGNSLFAWEATPPGVTGLAMLNLVSNILLNHALNASISAPTIIRANYGSFPPIDAGTLIALKWVAFFGVTMSVVPAFAALYVSRERRTSVQAMQFSNGLTNPMGLWLGHLLHDVIIPIVASSLIVIIFATTTSQFSGLAYLWLVLVLYAIASTLFAYCASLIALSPLAAFAMVAGYQVILFVLYLAGYLLTLTYAKTNKANSIITIIHFTISILAPVASVARAAFVSVNLFSLLCDGSNVVSALSAGTIMRYGGPIVYLIVWAIVLFCILVCVDSGYGTLLLQSLLFRGAKNRGIAPPQQEPGDEKTSELIQPDALLQVQGISKTFGNSKVVDNVSLDIARDTIFALLGPNGAGKTTTFNIIRGDVLPDCGEVLIDGASVITKTKIARLSLGVCPQFTAIEPELTVREHLSIYGRLKGIKQGSRLEANIESLMRATALDSYADREASKLSGGNQRKLALAISLMGNPSVILIDEFSTGIDAKMKRDMWGTLRHVAAGKAVVITTHSMEEASALASRVGIIARRMLAVGTPRSLSERYAQYEVHFSCRSRADTIKAQELMSHIPGSKMAEDVATRFEVPIDHSSGQSLAGLFRMLSKHGGDDAGWEYTVEKTTLETLFLKVIGENKVQEEGEG